MSADELPALHEALSDPAPRPVGPRPQRPGPQHLNLVAVSDDGKQLLLSDSEGVEFTVDIDPRLRAALSKGPGRRLEVQMDSMMRPRDIQTRIRSGESPESVAEAAQTTVDKVMPYAAPVLAEREHVAERAQRSSIRRPAGETSAGARTLGDAVAGRLRSLNVDPETVRWDAWRREDGRWSLVARYATPDHEGKAELTFDQPGNYVLVDNDDARWLVGEDLTDQVPGPGGHGSGQDEHERAPRRRLSAVPQEELPLGEDAIELVTDDRGIGAEQPLEAFLDDRPGLDETALREEAADAAALDPDPDATAEQRAVEEPPRRAVKKTKGRASVPSWDEIMFGGGGAE
jgi:hypothetical protein